MAERLVQKGPNITRDDISILLAEHLRTIEKLQQVSDAGKLIDQSQADEVTPRMTSSDGTVQSLKNRPSSGKGKRKPPASELDSQSITSNFSLNDENLCSEVHKADINSGDAVLRNPKTNRLPPISQAKTKLEKAKLPPLKLKANSVSDSRAKKLQPGSKDSDNGEQDSLQSSPETKAKNRRNLNESGIDSECDETETSGYEVIARSLYSDKFCNM